MPTRHTPTQLETERTNQLGELYFCAMYHLASYWQPGIVSMKAAAAIERATGLCTKNFAIRLYTDNLKHFLGKHVSERKKGNVPVRMADIEKLPYYINYFNHVNIDKEYDNRLIFKKETPTGLVHLVAEIHPRRQELVGITLWIQRR